MRQFLFSSPTAIQFFIWKRPDGRENGFVFAVTHWKPMPSIGAGVREIRIRDQAGAFRVIYLATVKDAVCVLHCFQKKTQKTSRADIDLAERRFRELMNEAKP